MEQLLATALSIEINVGSTQKLIEESSEALAATCQELEGQLPKEPVLNSDETGWRSMGERRWLWALVASSFVFFTVRNAAAVLKCWFICWEPCFPESCVATALGRT